MKQRIEFVCLTSHWLDDPDSIPGGDKDFFLRRQLQTASGPIQPHLQRVPGAGIKAPKREAIYVNLVVKLGMCEAASPTPHASIAYCLIKSSEECGDE